MTTCKEYDELHQSWKDQIDVLINRMSGKSHVADVSIDKSNLSSYDFKVTVYKYNSSGSRGWATIGYLRHDLFRGGVWRLTYKPRVLPSETSQAGRTGSYL